MRVNSSDLEKVEKTNANVACNRVLKTRLRVNVIENDGIDKLAIGSPRPGTRLHMCKMTIHRVIKPNGQHHRICKAQETRKISFLSSILANIHHHSLVFGSNQVPSNAPYSLLLVPAAFRKAPTSSAQPLHFPRPPYNNLGFKRSF
ncbi:hypothetical protein SUGI_0306720 [Cryptomeria japonica]|nr:hypothetical protein SUGI_0306720 [Cryptomeria japonica]